VRLRRATWDCRADLPCWPAGSLRTACLTVGPVEKQGGYGSNRPDSTNPGQLRELIRHAGDPAGRALRSETDERPHIEAYEVPAQPMDRVLDLRHWVKWNVDGSLTFAAPARMGSAARTRC